METHFRLCSAVTLLGFCFVLSLSLSATSVDAQVQWRSTDDSTDKYSSFNQSCSHPSQNETEVTEVVEGAPKPCNPIKFLTCSNETNRCTCKEGDENATFYKYDDIKDSCYPSEESELHFEPKVVIENCVSMRECWESIYGEFSRCNHNTGKCECYDTLTAGQQQTVKIDGTCHLLRVPGDNCETDAECNATIAGHAMCVKQSIHGNSNLGKCDCDGRSFWDNKLQECLRYADRNGLQFTCRSDLQCSHPVALSTLAKCDDMSRKCVCFDVNTNGRSPTGFYNGKCYLKLRANETCQNDIECRLGSGDDSACVDNPDDYDTTKHCQCHATHVWGETHLENDEKCLIIGKLNSQCTSDNQCQHESGLGRLSKCARYSNKPNEGQCVCWDPVQQSLDTTGFSNGACWHKKRQGERCESTEECVIGWSPEARCQEHESYNGERVCVCPEGSVCKSGASSKIVATTGGLTTLLTLVFVLVQFEY